MGADPFSEDQRNAALLVEQWNLALEKRARRWKKGQIYIHDIHSWLLDQIRQNQLKNTKWSSTSHDIVESQSLWQNVDVSCLGSIDHPLDGKQQIHREHRCSESNTYLFR